MNTRKLFFGILTIGILTGAACTSDNDDSYEQSVDRRHITKDNKNSVDRRHITKDNKNSVDRRHITKDNKNSKNNKRS